MRRSITDSKAKEGQKRGYAFWKKPVLAAAIATATLLGCAPVKRPATPGPDPSFSPVSMCESPVPKRSIEGWLDVLKTSATDRDCAVELLGAMGNAAVPGLIEATKHNDVQVRLAAVDALERIGLDKIGLDGKLICILTSQKGKTLVELAKGPEKDRITLALGSILMSSPHLRGEAAAVAAELGDARLLPALAIAAGDRNAGITERVVDAIGKIAEKNAGDARVLRTLPVLRIVLKEDYDCCGWPALAAVQAIGKIAASNQGSAEVAKAVPWIVEAITDGGLAWKADAGAETLAKIGKPAVPALLVVLKAGKHRKVAAMALEKIGYDNIGLREKLTCALLLGNTRWIEVYLGKIAVPELTGLLKDLDADVRMRAAQTLGALKDASALPELRTLSQSDSDPAVRDAAAKAIAAIPDN